MWKDQNDNFHNPKTMQTRHLFYTLRMIWNHHAPKQARLRPYREYKFPPFYTVEYMKQSVTVLMTELSTREDITPKWKLDLQHMRSWATLEQEQLKLEEVL